MHIKVRTYRCPRSCESPKHLPLLLHIFAVLVLFAFSCSTVAAGGTPGEKYAPLARGKDLLEEGRYAEAVESLRTAYVELPVIRDYTLFFLARTYNRMERFDDSAKCIDELLSAYPDSPLRKKARELQIRNLLLSKETTAFSLTLSGISRRDFLKDPAFGALEAYVADYPEDAQMMFFMAGLLKRLGETDRAKRFFLLVYTGNSSFSESAYQELLPSDITPEHSLTKASNLMKAMEYRKAETTLRKILPTARGALKEEVQRTLGLSLFRQKRYREAADTFLRTGDLYDAARSFYRAGEIASFRETLARLVSMEDRRAGSLLVAYAAKKRREGRPEESLAMYDEVRKKYPSLGEEALWGMAWTQYRRGYYGDAAELFAEMSKKYPSPRSLYWGKRSAELDNRDTACPKGREEAQAGKAPGKDFYSFLSYLRDKDGLNGRSISKARWVPKYRSSTDGQGLSAVKTEKLPSDVLPLFDRFGILMEIGMKEEAITELARISNRVSGPEALLTVCRMLQGVGAYKKAISLASGLPGGGAKQNERVDINDILYPLAYWPTVSEIADLNTLDPFILLAVMREESRFDPEARSIAGALGLMQIMPHTARVLDRSLNMDISDNSELYNVRVNISVGAYYLNSLLKEFGSLPVALAAYNAGRDKVREWIKGGNYRSPDEFIEDIPYDETRNYVKRVLLTYFTYLDMENRL